MKARWLAESELALKAISSSAGMLEEAYRDISFISKEGSRDVVTEFDINIEKNIRDVLSSSEYRIIGEEATKENILKFVQKETVWLIDPIDGTMNFVSSVPFYSISAGLYHDSKFIVGAVIVPTQKELYFTLGNQGSFMNNKALKVTPSNLQNALIAVAFSGEAYDEKNRRKEYELFGILNDKSRGCLRLGSASINVCYVAAGRLQAAYGISNKIWDVAGALAIALQAGCEVYFEWIRGTTRVNYVVAAKGIADEISDMLRKKNLANLKLIK